MSDTFYVLYCVFHLFVTLAVDAAIALPKEWTHPFQRQMLAMHMEMNNDPLVSASPIWLRAFVWIEIVLQVPFFIWAAVDLSRGRKRVWPVCLAYAIEASTTTFACLAEIVFSTSVESHSHRAKLLSLYVPTFLIPFYMAIDFGKRIGKELSAKPKAE